MLELNKLYNMDCMQGGLDFVGFEIDEDYCRAANERLEQEQAQIRLFDLLEQEERKAQATLFTK